MADRQEAHANHLRSAPRLPSERWTDRAVQGERIEDEKVNSQFQQLTRLIDEYSKRMPIRFVTRRNDLDHRDNAIRVQSCISMAAPLEKSPCPNCPSEQSTREQLLFDRRQDFADRPRLGCHLYRGVFVEPLLNFAFG